MATEASNNKRARTDEDGASSAIMTSADLRLRIASLPAAKLPALLEKLLASHPDAHATFNNLSNAIDEEEAERKRNLPPADFKYQVSECRYHLDKKYARLRPSQQFEIVGDIMGVIADAKREIYQACEEDPRTSTQITAIRALVEIATEMSDCRHYEIAKGLRYNVTELAATILERFESLADEHSDEKQAGSAVWKDIMQLASELSESGLEGLDDLAERFPSSAATAN